MLYYISTRLWLSEECFNIQKKGINVEGFTYVDNLWSGYYYSLVVTIQFTSIVTVMVLNSYVRLLILRGEK